MGDYLLPSVASALVPPTNQLLEEQPTDENGSTWSTSVMALTTIFRQSLRNKRSKTHLAETSPKTSNLAKSVKIYVA